jgi:hypothetical protein
MPAEAHRYTWHLGARDRFFMWLVAAATALAIVGIVVDHNRSTSYSPPAHCVSTVGAGFMGGVLTEYCGAKATALCRTQDAQKGRLAEQCARLEAAAKQ